MKFHFQQSIGRETLSREYKAFTLNTSLLGVMGDRLLPLARSGKWQFNHLVYRSISVYFSQFHKKYQEAFQTIDEPGELWIGVDDRGMVHGIPIQGTLDLDLLKKSCPDPNTIVEIFPVEFDTNLCRIPGKNPRVSSFIKEFEATNTLFEARNAAYRVWRNNFDKYTKKLVDLYNDPVTREEFLLYLSEHSPETLADLKHFSIEQKKFLEIRGYIERKEGVYYWMCKWKDDQLAQIRAQKPKKFSVKQRHRSTRYGPVRILSNVQEMVPYWFHRNVGMNLYVMKWTFLKVDHHKPPCFRRSLIVKNGILTPEPCCVPM